MPNVPAEALAINVRDEPAKLCAMSLIQFIHILSRAPGLPLLSLLLLHHRLRQSVNDHQALIVSASDDGVLDLLPLLQIVTVIGIIIATGNTAAEVAVVVAVTALVVGVVNHPSLLMLRLAKCTRAVSQIS